MPGILPLTLLCENVLMKHHTQLRDLGDTRYDLIKRVLQKCNPQQLMNLEASNPKLILDDENIWHNLLEKDFPQNVHERYTSTPSKIIQFFKQQLDELDFDYSDINLNNYIRIISVGNEFKKYRLPSKLLYLKYTEDVSKKEALAIENLRQKMRSLEQLKEETKLIQLNEIIPVDRVISRPVINNRSKRSELFQKAQIQTKRYKDNIFRNPSSSSKQRIIYAPQPNGFNSHSQLITKPQIANIPTAKESPVILPPSKVTKPSSPSKTKNVSIFIRKRPCSSSRKSQNTPTEQKRSTSPPIKQKRIDSPPNQPPRRTTITIESKERPATKKIKFGEYLARSRG